MSSDTEDEIGPDEIAELLGVRGGKERTRESGRARRAQLYKSMYKSDVPRRQSPNERVLQYGGRGAPVRFP